MLIDSRGVSCGGVMADLVLPQLIDCGQKSISAAHPMRQVDVDHVHTLSECTRVLKAEHWSDSLLLLQCCVFRELNAWLRMLRPNAACTSALPAASDTALRAACLQAPGAMSLVVTPNTASRNITRAVGGTRWRGPIGSVAGDFAECSLQSRRA